MDKEPALAYTQDIAYALRNAGPAFAGAGVGAAGSIADTGSWFSMAFRSLNGAALAYGPGWLQHGLDEYYGICHSGDYDPVESKRKRQEIYDAAVAELEAVFRSVQGYDSQTRPGLASATGQLGAFRQLVRSLRDTIDPYPESGSCALTLPAAELAQRLGTSDDALVDIPLRRFRTLDEDGNPVYDWEEIERVGGRGADDISAAEYLALAHLFAEMGEDDLTRLLRALPDRGGDWPVNSNTFTTDSGSTVWTFDEEKSDRLRAALYAYYSKQGTAYDRDPLTRLSLLGVLPTLGGAVDPTTGLIGNGIAGPVGAGYPPITVRIGSDGELVLDYYLLASVAAGGTSSYVRESVQTRLKPAIDANNGTSILRGFAQGSRSSGDFSAEIELGESIAIDIYGFVPGAGEASGIVSIFKSISDYIQGKREDEENRSSADTNLNNTVYLANVQSRFGFEVVIGSTPRTSDCPTVYIYEGAETSRILNDVNEALAGLPENERDSLVGKLGYPITADAIINKPEEANAFVDGYLIDSNSDGSSLPKILGS
jgi:hypothetical protein